MVVLATQLRRADAARLPTGGRLADRRDALLATIDVAAWALAIAGATWLRYDFSVGRISLGGLAVAVACAAFLQLSIGAICGLYRGHWNTASFDEVIAIACMAGATALLLTIVVMTGSAPRPVPVSVPVMAGAFALALMGGVRAGWRLVVERRLRPCGEGLRRVVVVGAGEGGEQVIRSMLRSPEGRFLPVAVVDDDRSLRRRVIHGVPVMGTSADLGCVVGATGADTLLVAIPSASAEVIRRVSEPAGDLGLEVKVLPPVGELLGAVVTEGDIRGLTEVDLLGRHQIDTDVASIGEYLRGKRVLVTGAGGSIGSELCRQIARFEPANLIMVDRDESALHGVQLSIEGKAMLDSPDVVLLDLRDRVAVARLLERRRPEVVFHAAALKHMPLLERHPGEAVKSNVWVTGNLVAAAVEVGVERFVNISTDKAADPANVLGYSKRIAERVTAFYARSASGAFMSVRFGNVLGSRGSVLGAFRTQIAAGGPVTVTDREVTRFFMTVEEAVQLVIQAAVVGRPGEALVLDMGEPVRIDDVARRLIAESGEDIEITYTGLRSGEKLHEVLFSHGEVDDRPVHPLISHVTVPPLDPGSIQMLDPTLDTDELIADMAALCHAFTEPTPTDVIDLTGDPTLRR